MDIKVEHEINGLEVRVEVYGIAPGTELQRVTDALRAVREGMSVPKVEEPERFDGHLDSDLKTIREQDQRLKSLAATIAAKNIAIKGLTDDRKKLNLEIAHLTQTLCEQTDELKARLKSQESLLKAAQDKLADSVKKQKATSRRLSTANKKLRNFTQ
jgi:chromosome segregation ATPase